jgi:hypothetical protein
MFLSCTNCHDSENEWIELAQRINSMILGVMVCCVSYDRLPYYLLTSFSLFLIVREVLPDNLKLESKIGE